jgi:uncharacterized protein YggE
MNVLKNMEAIFVIALATAGAASVAAGHVAPDAPEAQARTQVLARNSVATPPAMATVHVSAKRMSEAEKRMSLARERTGRTTGRA